MATPRLGVGVIGCGSIAVTAHLPVLRHWRDRVDLIAVCDVRADVARQVAADFGAPHWTTDYTKLLARPDIQVVVICTPEFLHGEQAAAAARAGKHILCEKPMADSLDAADAMIEAARTNGVKLMIGHSRRFTARYRAMRAAIDAGDIGAVTMVRENERRPIAQYAAQNLSVTEWSPDGEGRTWKDMAKYSFGVVLGHAIHEFDLLRWFAGSEAVEVFAQAQITDPVREVPDALAFTVRFANGVLGATDLYTNCPRHYPYYHQLEIAGERGLLRALDTSMETLRVYREAGMTFPVSYHTLLHVDDAYLLEHRLFYDAVERDEPVPLDPSHPRAALAIGLAARDSCVSGQPVRLAPPVGAGAGVAR